MNKRELLPGFVMLLAGAIALALMAVGGYDLRTLLGNLLIVLLVFYFIGRLVKFVLDRVAEQLKQATLDEGEVIEKQPDEAEE